MTNRVSDHKIYLCKICLYERFDLRAVSWYIEMDAIYITIAK